MFDDGACGGGACKLLDSGPCKLLDSGELLDSEVEIHTRPDTHPSTFALPDTPSDTRNFSMAPVMEKVRVYCPANSVIGLTPVHVIKPYTSHLFFNSFENYNQASLGFPIG